MDRLVLLLDKESKNSARIDNSVLYSDKVSIVETLLEISDDMLGTDRTVVILEGFVNVGNIPQLQMFKEVARLSYLFMVNREELKTLVKDLGRVFMCNTTFIDYGVLQAGYYDDSSVVAGPFDESSEYAAEVLAKKGYGKEAILAENYLHAIEREKVLTQEIAVLQEQLGGIMQKNKILEAENRRWENGCKQLLDRAFMLDQNLQKYETVLSRDIYTKVNLNSYSKHPAIIYFKVFTEFAGIHTFIEVLVDVFRRQQRKNVKVLQLFDSSGERRIRLLPDYYRRIRNSFTPQEVTMANYMSKSGECDNLLTRLLMNKTECDVLIIVDNKDLDDVVMTGSFLLYQLCHTSAQALKLGLNPRTTIINTGNKKWLSWSAACEKGLTEKEKFIKLSSRNVVKNIFENVRKYSNLV